jgi:cell division septation protein DedD
MPSREPELYKDKIEVSLDGRQIFYLFFGGAVIVGLVFVVGVMVGRRVESRGHLDRADTQTASDPLAALDRLERADKLSFHGALTGSEAASDVEKAIGELEKRRAAGKADKKDATSVISEARQAKPETRADTKPELKAEVKPEAKAEVKPEAKSDAKSDAKSNAKLERAEPKPELDAKIDARPDAERAKPDKSEAKADADKPKSDKHDGEHKARKHDDGAGESRSDARSDHADAKRSETKADKPVTRPDARSDARPDGKADERTAEVKRDAKIDGKSSSDARVRFTLQLSSFQDKSEAEAFLSSIKSAGFQPYLTEADVGGKGTFYRVRLGSFRSLEAANDAKVEFEKSAKKTAQVMRL